MSAINEEAIKTITKAFTELTERTGVQVRQSDYDRECIEVELDLTLINQETVNFSQLLVISETLGTRDINVGDYLRWGGCSTCGNGEQARVTIYARKCTKGLIGS